MSSEKSCHSTTGSCHGPSARELEGSGWFDQQGGILVTINPEARVSAVRVGPSIRPANAGAPVRVPIVIINKGFVTAPLRAVQLRPGPEVIDVSLADQPLSGAANERRELELRPAVRGPLDITIAFQISPEGGDLAGRDTIHLLLRG